MRLDFVQPRCGVARGAEQVEGQWAKRPSWLPCIADDLRLEFIVEVNQRQA